MFDLKNMCAHICLLSCYVSKINSQNNLILVIICMSMYIESPHAD